MSKDIKCPYCGVELDMNNENGYEVDANHEMQCRKCEKYFIFTTEVKFKHYSQKADCLNGEPHKYKLSNTYPKELSKMVCSICGDERELTNEEKVRFNVGSIEDYINELDPIK